MSKLNLANIQRQLDRAQEECEGLELCGRPMSLPVEEIQPNPRNIAAENDDEESIRQLADSIEAAGLIHPLTVNRTAPHQYTLLSGERRYRAIRLLGWTTVSCTVYDNLDEDMVTLVTVEANMEAREYTPAQRLALYSQLDGALRSLKARGKYKGGVGRGVAKILGVSEQQIGKYKRLCQSLDAEEIQHVKNINEAVRSLRPTEKTETQFQFSESPTPQKTETQFQFSELSPVTSSPEDARFAVRYKLRIAEDAVYGAWTAAEKAGFPEEVLSALRTIHTTLVDVMAQTSSR